MRHILFWAAMAAAGATALAAGTPDSAGVPRWLRNTAVSPDGSTIAFTYRGDIFTVAATGGDAFQLTAGSAYDTKPVWSPDSRTIVFASDREGSRDLYAVDAKGGTPRRLTTAPGSESPLAFIDANTVIYSSGEQTSRETMRHPTRLTRTYAVDVNTPGARPRLFQPMPMGAVDVAPDGRIIYEDKKGLEDVYRKHERSSGTSDIWTLDNGKFTKLTDFNGHDLNPVWKADGRGYWYVSEQDGTLNVYSADMQGNRKQLTGFTRHPVRSLSASDNGLLVFSWDGDIYTMREGAQPVRLDVRVNADQYVSDAVKAFAKGDADYMAVSPDGKEVAFVIRGEVYVTDTKYKTTRRITDTPAQERVVAFSPDGRTLVYDSDRDGQWQLFTAEIKNPAEKRFTYATEIVEKPLYKGKGVAQQPAFSPDGKKVAFLEDRTTLRVIDLKTKEVKTVLDGKYNYSYTDGDVPFEWSPDSQWLLVSYIGNGGWNNTDIAAVKADGSKVVDLTESGYADANPKWALGGRAVTYESGRFGMKSHGSWGNQSDVLLMALDAEAWDELNATEEEAALREEAEKEAKDAEKDKKEDKKGKKDKKDKKADKESVKPVNLDFEGRRDRMARLTERSAGIGDYWLAPKGDKLYYTAGSTEGGTNLYVHDLRKDESKMLLKGVSGSLQPDAKGENLFVISYKGMQKVDLAKGAAEPIEFEAPYDRSNALEREYMYDHMLRQVADKFYDVNLHGVDWKYYGDHYREFLPYINNGEDFAILLSEILGELNASHTGGRHYGDGPKMASASLGAFYDPAYTGDGLKVTEVVGGSPLAAKKADVRPGDIILSIDGHRIEAGKDYYPLLEGRAGRATRLEIERAGGKRDTVSVKPISNGRFSQLLYKRWVARNEAYVDSISNGRVAYVHVEGMDSRSFSEVYDRLLGKYRNAEAVIVDTRWNGGGWLHNDLAQLLSGRRYVDFKPRGQYIGSEPFSQWTKPSVMLVNEGNYSDAHGSPYTYKTLGIGKLVGAPVPGTMTAVWWETQIDPSIVFGIPQVTCVDLNGNALENKQLDVDVEVYNNPADEAAGRDAQLDAAVRTLLQGK